MHLHDARVELGRKAGHRRLPVEACRDDHALGLEAAFPALDHVAIADLRANAKIAVSPTLKQTCITFSSLSGVHILVSGLSLKRIIISVLAPIAFV